MTITVADLAQGQWSGSGPVASGPVSPTGTGMVILVVNTESNSAINQTVTSVTGLSVTWLLRSRNQKPGAPGQMTEVWYASVSSPPTGSVTFSLSGGIDDGTYHVLYAQSDTGSVPLWDTNASLPKLLNGPAGAATVSTDGTAPYVLIFSGSGTSAHNSNPVPVSTTLGSVSNGGAVLFEYSDVWGGTQTSALSNTVAGTTNTSSPSTVTVDALDEGWNGTAPPMSGVAAMQVPVAPPFIEFVATATAQMQGAKMPLVGADSPVSFKAKTAPLPVPPVHKVAAPTRVWHPARTYQRTCAGVRLAPLPSPPVRKVGHPPTRVWSNVAIFTHVTPRPSYGQLWPRGTLSGPSA